MTSGRYPIIELPTFPGPVEALRRLPTRPGRVLLHDARAALGWASGGDSRGVRAPRPGEGGWGGGMSILCAEPIEWIDGSLDPFRALELLRERWGATRAAGGERTGVPGGGLAAAGRSGDREDRAPFPGGAIGALAFEAGDLLEPLPPPPPLQAGDPAMGRFGVYDAALVWDWDTGRCFAQGVRTEFNSQAELQARLEALIDTVHSAPGLAATPPRATGLRPLIEHGPAEVATSLARPEFLRAVERVRELIRNGDLFQANLTRTLSVPLEIDGVDLYRRLLRESPAPYSSYLDLGDGEIASISPELFLAVEGGRVRTRPIKGTRPRGSEPALDQRYLEELTESVKDRAENVMIVDLLRNDLSRGCRPGSVQVTQLAEVESHPTVHHLVSTVEGALRPGVDGVELLRATFPGGSISGAPKIRALEVIRELEPVRRGYYTGAIGFLGMDGRMEWSVAIRTAHLRSGVATYGTGGGITLDSEPEEEWRETEDKARAFLQAIRSAE